MRVILRRAMFETNLKRPFSLKVVLMVVVMMMMMMTTMMMMM